MLTDSPKTRRAKADVRLLLVALSILLFLVDRLSKAWVERTLFLGDSIPLLPGVFHLTHVRNTGIAFSLFQEHPQILTAISTVFFGAFLIYGLTRGLTRARLEERPSDRQGVIVFSLILGGAAGNLWDRYTQGSVIDFLDVVAIHYPVFNLADTFIFCGVVLLILRFMKASGREG